MKVPASWPGRLVTWVDAKNEMHGMREKQRTLDAETRQQPKTHVLSALRRLRPQTWLSAPSLDTVGDLLEIALELAAFLA